MQIISPRNVADHPLVRFMHDAVLSSTGGNLPGVEESKDYGQKLQKSAIRPLLH